MNNTQADMETESLDTEIVENNNTSSNNINATINNINLPAQLDLEKLAKLNSVAPELANKVVGLFEYEQKQADRIITLEEKEQASRINEIPHQRKFAFSSLIFAALISFVALGTSVYFAILGYPRLAATSITIPIGLVAVNIIKIFQKK